MPHGTHMEINRMEINRQAPAIAAVEAYVEATPSEVWSVQSDFRTWPEWNPDIGRLDLQGPLAPGTEFRWTAGGVPIRSTLREVEPGHRLGWTGVAPIFGIRAIHTWSFEPEGTGTRVRTEESFEGLLPRLLPGAMRRLLSTTLEKNVAALKAEVERREGAA